MSNHDGITPTRPAPTAGHDDICAERLLGDLDTLATFGGRPDGGVDRVAGSCADLDARAWLARRIEQAGLTARTDDIGNVFGRTRTGAGPWLLLGSHTDTVPAGGRLDGAYGVIAALEVLRSLHEQHHPAAERVQIVSFWDEEGAAPTSTGGLTGSTALCATDAIQDFSAYLELHVEQGPRMEAAGLDLAVVDGIVGIDRYRVTVHGATNHAGTTPMNARADAGCAAASVLTQVRDLALDLDPDMVVTVGCLDLIPGAPNVIPGTATMTIEFRADEQDTLDMAEDRLEQLAHRVSAGEGCSATVTRISRKPVVRFHKRVRDLVELACTRTSPLTGQLMSYAGHDASVLSSCVPTGMLFVPSTGGISHAAQESTPAAQLVRGCQALRAAVVEYCS